MPQSTALTQPSHINHDSFLTNPNRPNHSKSLQHVRFIDLFAGIGGFHQALSRFGARCVFASEWDKHASQTYQDNYGIAPFGDITQINEADIPAHDILCAGFPCQAFSISGKQKGFDDTRGTLFFDIARITRQHRPKILLLENVKNLLRHDKGNTLTTIVSTLQDLGYVVHFSLLNASDFGLPQNRERVYFVAIRQDLPHTEFVFPCLSGQTVCLNDVLQDNPDAKVIERDDIDVYKQYEPEQDSTGSYILPNRPVQIGIVNKGGQGERIYHPLGHAITLSAHGGGVGAKTGLYKIGETIRKLSPRECARLQGFPDTFKITASPAQAYKQFGNSVAVSVLVAIIKAMIEQDIFDFQE